MAHVQLPSRMHRMAFDTVLATAPPRLAAVWHPLRIGGFLGFGSRPNPAQVRTIQNAIAAVKPELEKTSAGQGGPYGDENNHVYDLAKEIRREAGGRHADILLAVYDLVSPLNIQRPLRRMTDSGYAFIQQEGIARNGSNRRPLNAGRLFGLEPVAAESDFGPTGMRGIPVFSAVEMDVLAVAVLRRLGMDAHYAIAVGMPMPGVDIVPAPPWFGTGLPATALPVQKSHMNPAVVILDAPASEVAVFCTTPEFLWQNPLQEVHIVDDRGVQSHLIALAAAEMAAGLGMGIRAKVVEILRTAGVKENLIGELERGRASVAGSRVEMGLTAVVSDKTGFGGRHEHTAREVLVACNAITKAQAEAIERDYFMWTMHNGLDNALDAIASGLKEARALFGDNYLFDEIGRMIARALPNQHWVRISREMGEGPE